jgi:hypothetical protein
VGLRTARHGLVWFQDRRNTWERRAEKREPARLLPRFAIRLRGFHPGAYSVEWFDTTNGHPIVTNPARADAEGLVVELSPLVRAPDVACKIRPAAEPTDSPTFPASAARRVRPSARGRDRVLLGR